MKENENIYRKARTRAAEFNEKFKNRDGASETLGVSKDSLINYELGLCKQVPVDVVVRMADAYNAPELMNYYCCNECPIGKLTISPVDQTNINNIYKLSINIFNLIGEGNQLRNTLLDIVEDGVIDESEKEDLDKILDNLRKLAGLTNDLIIVTEKLKN
ncbi:TPA: transcriptional regulator [Clostridium botulinum]|nr:transcriptional regulator [Clostridium botulinum]